MTRIVFVLVAFLFSSLPLYAAPISFSAILTGPNEEPPNASTGSGVAVVTLDDLAHTLQVQVLFADLIGLTTASHIHVINGPGDLNTADTVGPVATTTPTFPGFPSGVTGGSYNETFDSLDDGTYRPGFITASGGTTALAEAALFTAIIEGRAYLNIHSETFPGGEIRGFLEPAATPIPEPASLLLLGSGFAAAECRRRRQRR